MVDIWRYITSSLVVSTVRSLDPRAWQSLAKNFLRLLNRVYNPCWNTRLCYEASESGSGSDVWLVKEHFTPYEYAIYEYVDVHTSMYSSRLMERNELCEL